MNGVPVSKAIVRQTLTPILIGGTYYGTAVVVHSGCDTASNNGTVLTDFDPVVAQTTGNQVQFDFLYAGTENCTLAGAYSREGLLFRVPVASYVCKNGSTTTVSTTATIYEMKATSIARRPLARDERRRRMRRRRQVRDRVSLKLSQHATFAGARIRTGRPPPPRRR